MPSNSQLALLSLHAALGAACLGQQWDQPAVTTLISGQPFDTTATAGLIVKDTDLWYVDYDGSNSPPATDVADVKLTYRYPAAWHADRTETIFADNPQSSPTGASVEITVSVDAAVYEITGSVCEGYVVGILRIYRATSNGQTADLVIFDPGVIVPDEETARKRVKFLGAGDAPAPLGGTGGDPACIQVCKNNYETEKKNAVDRYLSNTKAYCSVLSLPGGLIAGCYAGTALCGWLVPPFSSVFCCLGGAIIGGASAYSTCVYAQTVILEGDMQIAENNYRNCLVNCGVIFQQ